MQENGYTSVREREEGEEDGIFNIRGMLRENDEWMSLLLYDIRNGNCTKRTQKKKERLSKRG